MTQEPTQTPEAPVEDAATPAPAAEAAVPPEAAPSAREAELEAQAEKLKADLLYARAETENVRRRLEQQAEERGKYAVSNFARDVLQVADNLRRALDTIAPEQRTDDPLASKLAEGVELTERSLIATLERHGIKKIEAIGQRFDPNLHQAMMEVEDPSQPVGTVVFEMQAGYTIHGRLLRAAMVGVSKGGAKPALGEGGVDTTA